MARPYEVEDWMFEAVGLMVQNSCSLKQAAMELGKELTSSEADTILRRRSFNKILWQERYKYHSELATDPNFRKESIIGKLLCLAQKLEDEGEHDKAADCLFKAAKAAGFIGPDSTVSVFGELSARELDEIREKALEKSQVKPN